MCERLKLKLMLSRCSRKIEGKEVINYVTMLKNSKDAVVDGKTKQPLKYECS